MVEHEPVPGVHVVEWLAEGLGTALLLVGGLSAVCLDFGSGSPVARVVGDPSARLLLTGLLFSGTGSLVAVSPLGRRSGAHLNPAVTLALRVAGRVHAHDLAGYVVAQLLGATAGAAVVRLLWGDVAVSIGDGVTTPGPHTSALAAVAIEALMTAILILTIFGCLRDRRLAPWTPLVLWPVIAALVWRGAPYTGTSLNPARSLGPALVADRWNDVWIYVAGPLLGALSVALVVRALPQMRPLTGKLYHDPRYPSTMGSALPVAPSS